MKRSLIAGVAAGTVLAGAAPLAATAAVTHTGACHGATVRDVIAKDDSGHGSPAQWAHLKLIRTTTVTCTAPGVYTITLVDRGALVTIKGAGNPNGSGGTIAHAVHGTVSGVYHLTGEGQLDVPAHRDTTLGSSDYVRALFTKDSTVTGKAYAWTYTTVCGERWKDASDNNDGQDASAGGITGKIFWKCLKHTPTPTPTATPTPTPTESTPPGQAPAPTPVPSDLPVTG